ncbi:UDP-glucose:sterol glycosyltransferase [Lineolata rhizophorae]|uniref:Sterol 3-beta-glucosyltransferase n=1 Tax=Lineolata rhizophorae TaxID=578093 RepID=A0A6A6P0W2_9PEZI|nr:UDP-glucose:sterol glycosyltransferase [Lineolata rhizophorae]
MDLPERLRHGDDADDDVTAPKGRNARYMNQSIFSMITKAGSQAGLQTRFDEASSDDDDAESDENSDDDDDDDDAMSVTAQPSSAAAAAKSSNKSKSAIFLKHRRHISESKLLKSLPKLKIKSSKERKGPGKGAEESPSQSSGRRSSSSDAAREQTRNDAPVMSRMLKARAELEGSFSDDEGRGVRQQHPTAPRGKASVSLAQRLMEIFGFEEPEEVISEYPCWLVQSVLLQGYMYVTQKHVCFYAYLTKKGDVVKSGYMSKRGRSNPKYHRYWFVLKGDVLSYYLHPTDRYFLSGTIDLRYSISAALTEPKDKSKEATGFSLTTDQRTYHFKADSASSATEWVRQLQKVIFRSHNDGDSVKISLPVDNIIDIEENAVLDFADTVKIRAIDSDETYAIDEYYFSFFGFGADAIHVLRIMVDGNNLREDEEELGRTSEKLPCEVAESSQPQRHLSASRDRRSDSPALRENVKSTLSPLSPTGRILSSPRASVEIRRSSTERGRKSVDVSRQGTRQSLDRGRQSFSVSRSVSWSKGRRPDKSPPNKKPHESTDSVSNSLDPGTESSAAIQSIDDTNASASQILSRSDVFQTPTINHPQLANAADSDRAPRYSQDTARSATALKRPPHSSRLGTRSSSQTPNEFDGSDDPQTGKTTASSSAIQDFVKAGSYPLQRAGDIASYLQNRSRKMSSLLATESMGYYEKVSGMWAGGKRHYSVAEGLMPDDHVMGADEDEDTSDHEERFRTHFALADTEKLQATYFGHLSRVLPLYGKIYVGNRHFCFRSLIPGMRTKLVLPLKDIENVDKEKGFRFGYSGLVITIRGHEELFFEFNLAEIRDDCAVMLHRRLDTLRYMEESGDEDTRNMDAALVEHKMLQEARQEEYADHDMILPRDFSEGGGGADGPPIIFDDPRVSILNFSPSDSLRITCLTIGSRGDVQPYIALCKGLLAEGHKPRIATHAEFEPWVRKHGIDFAPVEGDPAELMRICVENGMFTYAFLKEASSKFRGWLDELFSSAWSACQNSDLLIESPSAMAGIHIAEALEIPYFRAFTMPWTRTRAYPHAFAVPEHKMGGAYNYYSYVMFDNVFWKAIAGQVNRWRKSELGLGSTNLEKLQPNKVPFLYNFSPSVVPPPIDYSDWIRVSGYWFLDEATDWRPSEELLAFIRKARTDKKKLVYVGFGSIVVDDPAALTKTVVESVDKADVRCILSKGWSDRLGKKDATAPEVPLPVDIFQIKSAPHDWLFQQIDAAVHHGGAGTTGASLRSGIPTIIKPFFGDQWFFGNRVEDLGVGICMKKVNTTVFARALWEATHNERMIIKAKVLGEQIRKEDGVGNAIKAIYRDMEYAKSLIKRRDRRSADEQQEESEESWTFVGDESDPELARRMAEWEPTQPEAKAMALGSIALRGAGMGLAK